MNRKIDGLLFNYYYFFYKKINTPYQLINVQRAKVYEIDFEIKLFLFFYFSLEHIKYLIVDLLSYVSEPSCTSKFV